MSKESLGTKNVIQAGLAFFTGLYLMLIAPIFYDATIYKLIFKMSKEGTKLIGNPGPLSRLYIASYYSGVEMMVAAALMIVAYAFLIKKKWAYPVSMALLSIPAMFTGYIGLGWLENLKEFPPAYYTWFLVLGVFWAMIFLNTDEKKNKLTQLGVLTLIGMIGAQGVMLFPHALRVILKDPVAALLEYESAVLRRTGPLMFLAFILAIFAIYYITQRKEAGIYLGILTGMVMAAGAFPAHYARPLVNSLMSADSEVAASIFTSTYWMAGAQGVIICLALIYVRLFKPGLLFDEE